jgi:DNA-binding response OmpR family regulator
MQKPTILYVEDEEDDVFFLRAALQRTAAAVTLAVVTDGPMAISYLAGEGRFGDRGAFPIPALTLLDLNLPIQSGFEILEWIRENPDCGASPVIVFSSSGRPEDRERARDLGAIDFIQKPTSGSEFDAVVRNIVRHVNETRDRAGDSHRPSATDDGSQPVTTARGL